MSTIKSVSLCVGSSKIYRKINKKRPYGWFSQDVQEMLFNKYESDKGELMQEINDKQKLRNNLDDEIKLIAKKINRLKK